MWARYINCALPCSFQCKRSNHVVFYREVLGPYRASYCLCGHPRLADFSCQIQAAQMCQFFGSCILEVS